MSTILCILQFQNYITYKLSMPPKKDQKKQAVSKPDNSGIPKQDVQFKFQFEIISDSANPPAHVVMFEWFGVTSDKIQRFDAGSIENWQKSQNKYTFQKVMDLIRVQDDFCKAITSKKFYIYFVNAEDSKVEDALYLDYSSLLMGKQQSEQKYTYSASTIKVMQIDEFTINLVADKPLLQEVYRHYLNPFEVQVIAAKDVPTDIGNKYQPTYIKYSFFDGTSVSTHPVVANNILVWNHKHVFLAGFLDPLQLKQKIRSRYLKFQLHDRDQVNITKIKEDVQLFDISKAIAEEMEKQKPIQEDPKKKGAKKEDKKEVKKQAKKDTKKKDVKIGEPILPAKIQTLKNNYGIAAYYLVDFLKPSMRTSKYKAPVVPRNTFQDFQSKNIDLNTTARNQMQKALSTNNYFELDTKLLVGFTISYPIGTFVKPEMKQQAVQDPKKAKKEAKVPQQAQEIPKQGGAQQKAQPKDIYQRVVYIIPYKDAQTIKKIENIIYNVNMKAFKLNNLRQLTTYLLKPQEKASKTIDYLTSIQIIDTQARVYIIQGLRAGAMKVLHQAMQKTTPNTKTKKILKNSSIGYLKRLYADFNLDVKRIRLRPSLSQLLLDPNIYIKSKVAQEICLNLNRINDIKKLCDDLKAVDSMNLWPESQWLVLIQRKYSDSLSYEDIHGCEQLSKSKKKIQAQKSQQGAKSKAINFLQKSQLKFSQTAQQLFLPKIKTIESKLGATMPQQQMQNTMQGTKKNVLTKTFKKDETKLLQTYKLHLKKSEIPDNEPVYIYAGQKNNWYEKQMRQLREKINADKNAVYTFSKNHLSLSVDPRTLEEYSKLQETLNQSKMYSQQKFSSLIIKTKQQRMKLPKKPHEEDIEVLRKYPYHQQKQREKQLTKPIRDLPLNSDKEQFKKYIRKFEYFSQPEVVQGQKISPAERAQMQREQRKKKQQQQKKKRLGDSVIKIKKGAYSEKATGTDRFKDIREGDAKKLGFIDLNKKTKTKRPIEGYQVSLFLNQDKIDPSFNPLIRVDEPVHNIDVDQFNFYQRPQILTHSKLTKPLKPPQF